MTCFFNFENALTDAQKLSEFLDINLDWETPTIKAPVHVRQILEILKLLYKDVDVLISIECDLALREVVTWRTLGIVIAITPDGLL